MKTLTKFGFSSPQYVFPNQAQISYTDNFSQLVTRASRLPGAHGGFDELGSGRSLHEIGSITAEFWLKDLTVSQATSYLESFLQMGDWGKQVLYMQPTDKALTPRWCYARVDDISYNQNVRNLPHKRLKVKVIFQVPDPFWYGAGNQVLWDGTYFYNGAVNWDNGSFTTVTGSGTLTVTPSGNAFTLGRVVAKVTGAQAFNQFIVRRLVNNAAVDEVILQTPLVQNDMIEIDPRKQWVTVNGVDQIANFSFKHPDWLRLDPSANSVQIRLDETTAAVSANVFYYERYT